MALINPTIALMSTQVKFTFISMNSYVSFVFSLFLIFTLITTRLETIDNAKLETMFNQSVKSKLVNQLLFTNSTVYCFI